MAEPTGYTKRGLFSFTPSIQIEVALVREVQSNVAWSTKRGFIAIDTSTDPELDHGYPKLPTWGKINDEIVEIVSLVDDPGGAGQTVVLNRGILDTLPQEHIIGSTLWFAGDWIGVDKTEWTAGETVWAKAALVGSSFETPLSKVIPMSLPVVGRAAYPYAPGKFQINGAYWPASVSGDLTVSWAHRDRIQQTVPNSYIDQSYGSIGPEAGVTYDLRVYNNTQGYLIFDENVGAVASKVLAAAGTNNGAHLHWRMRVDAATVPDRVFVFWLEMTTTPGGSDQCNGGTATASRTDGSGFSPAYAFDESSNSSWYASPCIGEWLAYEFLAPVAIVEVTLQYYIQSVSQTTGFTIQYSDNGVDWSDAWAVTGISPTWSTHERRSWQDGLPGWDAADELEVTLTAIRDGFSNYQSQTHTFTV